MELAGPEFYRQIEEEYNVALRRKSRYPQAWEEYWAWLAIVQIQSNLLNANFNFKSLKLEEQGRASPNNECSGTNSDLPGKKKVIFK